MIRLKAPPGTSAVSIERQTFNTDAEGVIVVPDHFVPVLVGLKFTFLERVVEGSPASQVQKPADVSPSTPNVAEPVDVANAYDNDEYREVSSTPVDDQNPE